MKLVELIEVYRVYRPQLAESSADQLRWAVRSLEKHLGRQPTTEDFTEAAFLRFLGSRLARVAARTVKRERGDLLTLWRFAWRRKLTTVDPRDCELPPIAVPREIPVSLTVAQMKSLLRACLDEPGVIRGTTVAKADWWQALVLTLYHSGARCGATLKTVWSDWDGQRLHLRAADAKTRIGRGNRASSA